MTESLEDKILNLGFDVETQTRFNTVASKILPAIPAAVDRFRARFQQLCDKAAAAPNGADQADIPACFDKLIRSHFEQSSRDRSFEVGKHVGGVLFAEGIDIVNFLVAYVSGLNHLFAASGRKDLKLSAADAAAVAVAGNTFFSLDRSSVGEGFFGAKARATQQNYDSALDTLEAIVTTLIDDIDEVSREIGSTGGELTEIASGAAEQSDRTVKCASDAAAIAERANGSSRELLRVLDDLSRQAAKSREAAENAGAFVEETVKAMTDLDEGASGIGDILTMINRIAGQTHMLSLNATIEATRAGETGAGFAVVAKEVKSLATQTGQATDGIGAQLDRLQSVSANAVEAVGANSEKFTEIRGLVSHMTEDLQNQIEAVRRMGDDIATIAAASAEIVELIRQVNDMAQRNDAISDRMAATAAKLQDSVNVSRSRVAEQVQALRH